MSVKNPLSDFEVREKIVFHPSEVLEQEENSREPPHHFELKWEGNAKKSTLQVLTEDEVKSAIKKLGKKLKNAGEDNLGLPRSYTADDNGKFVPILVMECRGLEPYQFYPMNQGEFIVTSEGGVKFDSDIDLSEGDWAEYDEKNDQAVTIAEFASKFVAV